MKSIKNVTKGLLVIALAAVLSACGNNADGNNKSSKNGSTTIAISGSTSVGPFAEKLAHKYEENNDVKIEINQIGSSAGITNAINGVSEIGMSSRDLKQEEIESGLNEIVIAFDGIVVVTHPTNKVKDLTLEQVKRYSPVK